MANATERPTSSETTGPRSLGSVALSAIGQRRGETGSVVVPMNVPAIAAAETPAAVEKSIEAALPTTLRSRLNWTFSQDHIPVGVTLHGIEAVPDEDIARGLALTLGATRPAEPRAIIEGLAKADMVTKARAAETMDGKARIAVFIEDLREFPTDVVADAFRKWRRMEKFAPTVAEIRELCWRAMPMRSGLRRALEREAVKRGMEVRP